jgi:nicotinate-nucleotide adenylyltransferase
MLEAAVTETPGLVVDPREIERSGPSFTVDTLRSLREELPGNSLCLLLGGDAFNGFPGWHRPGEILQLANIAILRRPAQTVSDNVRPLYEARRVDRLDPAMSGQVVDCPVTQLAISASDIRRRCAAGRRIDFLVPERVRALIEDSGVYRDRQ